MDKTEATTKQVTIDISIDQETKEAAEQVLEALGIPLDVAINVFLKQVVIQRGIPFPITLHKIKQSGFSAL